ncbi:hypothetical protein G3I59_11185 [Amycolatopsis rubida]|uniref:Uncharacterized protein n=1 Tax=Amycolatopsis rubida TaxID=112413 RepID=A0A1I5NZ59_9PSEU|nr:MULTISPECIES: hypothetical protein [Amycolatopsis]MYW91154.1 hypothetical protein [Amycolatopsis rubida]NEC56139.1 hypothetical protein [Amycolatopsis rubida]OAP21003.1 hypothetical protein A4R44_08212 [Amycolatopsis sp. M39]SFP27055.1 hypothetical protein SAMN05421854_104580 [Amycolatopsis rubida]
MVDLAETLDDIRVRVRAPGSDIEAELRRRTDITLSFGESVYEFIDEPALERVLAGIARLLWAGWQRQYRAAIDETDLNIDADDARDSNFFADRAQVEAIGGSADERITISAAGMADFSVRVKPGTVREIPEDQFSASVSEAAAKLIQDFQLKVDDLKKRYYE